MIFIENKVQKKNDSTSKEKLEIATVQVEERQEQEVLDSSKVTLKHEEQSKFATP